MTLSDQGYSEKRNFIRMKIETPAEVEISSEDLSLSGICHDLSGGGMLIEVEKALPVGMQLEVTLSSGHGHSPMLKAKTQVARVSSNHSGTCTLGLEILEMIK